MNETQLHQLIKARMQAAGISAPTIHAFLNAVQKVQRGDRGMFPESAIEPIPSLPRLEEVPSPDSMSRSLLLELAVIKLNGGLGTSMGLEKAKSLIPVK